MSLPQEIIEDIRKNKYGIGLKTDPQSEKVIEGLKSILNTALERLAQDLYSKETHFVLELLQNADDNDYDNSVTPTLRFVIDNEKILLQNNEKGFMEGHVRALCDVGKTTKSKVLGYIGEKGIGFKSVFRISNEPKIFSNGFQFKFKLEDEQDKLGYVVPHWIEEVPDYIDEKQTNIVLPLKDEAKKSLTQFSEIEPVTILFLRKLKIIEIHNEGKINKIVRYDKEDGKVEIEHPHGVEHWKLVRHDLQVPEQIQEEKRKDVKETELILAFPLKPDGMADTTSEQKVFAYLPTRAYGFKFVIQADFLVLSNREDIHKDKSWNKWLRDNIASVFLRAVEEFKQDENLKKTYYNYIPLANEVTDEFFSPVVSQIYSNLRLSECILTESGNWLKPIDVFIADKNIRAIILNDDLKKFFGKEYISSNVKVNKPILDALEVKEFEFSHLVQCLQKTEWLEQQSDEWFIRLYSYLNNKNLSKEQLEELKKLKIFRLENNELTSITEKPIFFPLDKKGDYGFEKELRILKRTIFEPEEKEFREAVRQFLKNMGVRDASPYEIIEEHILPVYESDDKKTNWQSKDAKTLSGYIKYIKDNLDEYEKESDKRLNANKKSWESKEDPLRRLKKSLYIRIYKTVDGTNYYDNPENIYLPRSYGNDNNLESLFEGIESISFVHQEYIDDIIKKYRQAKRKGKKSKADIKKRREAEIKEWMEFFVKFGVNEAPRVIHYIGDVSYEDRYPTQDERENFTWWQIVHDWRLSNEFANLLKSNDVKKKSSLLHILDKEWSQRYSKYLKMRYIWFYRSEKSKELPSTFIRELREMTIPTTKGWHKSSDVFLNKPEIKEILGNSVPYLAAEIKNEEFIRALGINTEVTIEGVLNCLKLLRKQKCQDKSIFTKLYEFINKKYEGNEEIIKSTFSENQIIYILETSQSYFTSREVLWKDVSDIFRENRGYLEKHYPKLKSFFVDKLGVSEKPTPKDYANVLRDLSKKEKIDENDEKIILKIYSELNYHLNPENVDHLISDEDWWKDFVNKPIIWTDKEKFWKNDNNVFVNDNKELYELFKDKSQLAFLKLPENYHPKLRHFIKATGVPYLTNAVEANLADETGKFEEKNLTEQIQRFGKYILRYLYHTAASDYERLKANGTLAQLKNLKCFALEKVQVKYTLSGNTVYAQRNAILHNGNLYIQKDRLEDTDCLAVELSNLFGEVRGIDDFLILLFDKESDERIENLMKAKGIQDLSNEEKEWFGIVKLERKEIEEKKEEEEIIVEEKPSVSHPSDETLTKTPTGVPEELEIGAEQGLIEKTEWQPECAPEEVETHIEEVQFIEKTGSVPSEEKKQISVSTEPPKKDVLSQEDKMAIGRWGEEYALKYLKEKLSAKYSGTEVKETDDGFTVSIDGKIIVRVHWLNKTEDKGEGYDIKVIKENDEEYIEVKSTSTDTAYWFDVSRKQWELMKQMEDKFYIYRVYNVGTKEARLIEIPNPYKKWQEGVLTAYPIRIQI